MARGRSNQAKAIEKSRRKNTKDKNLKRRNRENN